jgi:hypothetical protein
MLGVITAGAAPERSFFRVLPQVSPDCNGSQPASLFQVLLAGLLRGVMLIYLGHFSRIVRRCQRSPNAAKTSLDR